MLKVALFQKYKDSLSLTVYFLYFCHLFVISMCLLDRERQAQRLDSRRKAGHLATLFMERHTIIIVIIIFNKKKKI